jgi:hypothetical protein
MSTETASSAPTSLPRPPRGTSTGAPRFNSSRGGRRGGYGASRSGLGGTKNSPPESSDWAAQEDNSSTDTSEEVAQLKAKYSNQLKSLKEIFPDWTAEDLVFALQEVDGNIEIATDRIAGGSLLFFTSLMCRSCITMGTGQEKVPKGQAKDYRTT